MKQKTKEQMEKEKALEQILRDKSNVYRLLPNYSTKMQTIRSNKVEA